jgi:hypothetical protein
MVEIGSLHDHNVIKGSVIGRLHVTSTVHVNGANM